MRVLPKSLVCITAVIISALPVSADDGGISFGGSPHLLSANKHIAMKQERIVVTIGEKLIHVDCQFVFDNDGPASRVRMGFPDEGRGAEDPGYWNSERKKGVPLKGTFQSYKSFVDGKAVPTTTVQGKDLSSVWHEKTVQFKAHTTCQIHDVYTVLPGAQVTKSGEGLYSQTSYVLHTASSWRGAIGKAEVEFTFEPKVLNAPVKVLPMKGSPMEMVWDKVAQNTCYYAGFGTPTVKDNTLTFVKSNFRPTQKDDIFLYYGHHKLKQ